MRAFPMNPMRHSRRQPPTATRLRIAAVVATLACASSRTAAAQSTGWHVKGQVNASLTFGASDQRLIATRAEVSRADSSLELSTTLQFRYGESSGANGVRSVHARSWLASLNADSHPFATISTFVFGTVGSSYEQRLLHRESGGVGMKWTLVHTPKARASLSGAVLGEYSRSFTTSTAGVHDTESLARWSLRAKFDRKLDRASFAHVTTYQPALTDATSYLVMSISQFSYALTAKVAATATFSDYYDSDAIGRGARAANDGQLLFGLAVTR